MSFQTVLKYINHYFGSGNAYSIHSPFVYKFYTDGVLKKHGKDLFSDIEKLRNKLLKDKSEINVTDYGAGGVDNNMFKSISVEKIVSSSSMKPSLCRLLASTVGFFQPSAILELGTAAGFSAMYMAKQCPKARITTVEGSEEIYRLACDNFKSLGFDNISAINDTFDNVLDKILNEIKYIDIVLFDGNHRKEPTLKYFSACLQHIKEDTVFIFDDIYWSEEMEEAWKIICNNQNVSVSVDLFFFGLVFFRKGIVKQHFSLRA